MNRRCFLKSTLGVTIAPAAITLISTRVSGQTNWPAHDVTIIVPFPPGGQADFAARPVAAALQKTFGKAFVVENRAGGAGGSVGNAIAARASPDGYTLFDGVVVSGGPSGGRQVVRT